MVLEGPAITRGRPGFDAVSAGTSELREHGRQIVHRRIAVADEQHARACRSLFLVRAAGVVLEDQEAKRNGGAGAGHHQDPLGSPPGHAAMMRARWLEDVVLTALS